MLPFGRLVSAQTRLCSLRSLRLLWYAQILNHMPGVMELLELGKELRMTTFNFEKLLVASSKGHDLLA